MTPALLSPSYRALKQAVIARTALGGASVQLDVLTIAATGVFVTEVRCRLASCANPSAS